MAEKEECTAIYNNVHIPSCDIPYKPVCVIVIYNKTSLDDQSNARHDAMTHPKVPA